MKKIIFLTALLMTTLIILPGSVQAQDYPPFTVHVAPLGNCNGNQAGAYVTITYQGGSQSGYTLDDGTIVLTAPVGSVYVTASYQGHSGVCCSNCDQPMNGYGTAFVCINDQNCSIQRENETELTFYQK